MAVKHKAERVEKPKEIPLELILRALQDINGHTIDNEKAKACKKMVLSLGGVTMPESEGYVSFMTGIKKLQDVLIQACSSEEIVYATLQALYNAISEPCTQPPHPTMSIVLQIVDVKLLPQIVQWILHSGYTIDSLERALMTLCHWLAHWTYTPNLGPLVLHFMQGMETEHHDVIIDITLSCIAKLFILLIIPQNRESVGPVVLYMLEKVQNQQAAFFKIKHQIPKVLHSLHKENSESSHSYLKCVCNLCVILIRTSPPDSKEMYEEVFTALQSCSSTDNATIAMPLPNSPGKVGLTNLGNTCYMNSVLQALFMTKVFCNDVLSSTCYHKKLLSELQRLFALLQYSQRISLSPHEILNLARPPGFQPGQQHDSSEFLGFLLDTLHEQERINIQSGDGIMEISSNGPTIVQQSFGGKAVTASKCDICNTQSEHTDHFRDLQLSFPYNVCDVTVQKLLDYYFQPEKLSGDNQYHCDTCKRLTDGERVTRVVEPPARLILTLKHFRYDTASQERRKLLNHVQLDVLVNLNQICYELYAAVVHSGSSMDSGHYYTFARDGDVWFRFNDILVTKTSFEELHSIRPPSTPYILFYRKQDCPDPNILPKSSLPPYLVDIISRDLLDLDTERRRRPTKVYNMRNKRNDDPPPPGCGGGSFRDSLNNSRYIC